MADDRGLDLVEVQPNAEPPVCKIMDYGKFKYDEGMKRKQTRKTQQKQVVKEIKFHANVDRHDLETKMRKIRDFIEDGIKVKLTLTYRGRENAHKDLGFETIQTVIKELEDVTVCEQAPKLLGRMLGCLLAPKPKAKGSQKQPKAPAPAQDTNEEA